MENLNWTLILLAIAILALIFSRGARLLLAGIIAIFLIAGAARTAFRYHVCTGAESCPLQPTYAGPCYPMNNSALITVDETYHLVPDDSGTAEARCLSWMVWQ